MKSRQRSPSGALERAVALVGTGLWSIADQSLLSLTNFGTMVLLGRALEPVEFGWFVVLFAALIFAGNLQAALISRPHNVLAATMAADEFAAYTRGAAACQVALAAGLGGLALAGAGVSLVASGGLSMLLVALAAALVAWQLQEFVRQVRYTQGRPFDAFVYDLISYGGQAALLVGLWQASRLTGVTALLAIAVTSIVSAAYGFWRLEAWPAREWTAARRKNWTFGKWLLGDSIGTTLSMELFPLLTASIVGLGAAAMLMTVKNLVRPVHVVFSAYQTFAVPRASRAFQRGGRRALAKFLLPASAAVAVPLAAYLLLVCLAGNFIVEELYDHRYHEVGSLVWAYGATYFAQHIVDTQVVALLAEGRPRCVFLGRAVAMVLTLTVGIGLVWQFGIWGSVAGGLMTLAARFLVLGWYLTQDESVGAPTTETAALPEAASQGQASMATAAGEA